ncbi:MAG TPA: acyltransferase [Prosthecobacter sp.]|nr:acyltransferase [Prosthecobacter sp.]
MRTNLQRLPGLDGLRAFAVLTVVFSHVHVSQGFPDVAWVSQLHRAFSGVLGVQVFFGISGFIITHLLWREKGSTGGISLKNFWLRRCARILPPALAFVLVIQIIHFIGTANVAEETQWASLLFYRNMLPQEPWFADAQGFTGHYWSLSVEEQFYVVWPLLVAALPLRALKQVAWAAVGMSVMLRAASPWLPEGSLRWLPMNLDCFMVGALVAFDGAMWRRLWRWRWVLLGLALVMTRMEGSAYKIFFAILLPLTAAVASGAWIAGLVQGEQSLDARLLNSRPVAALGMISFSVYLWQQLCLAPASEWSSGQAPWLARFPQNLAACLACGVLGYWLIERPCQQLKAWLIRPRRAADALTASCPP